MSDPSEAGVPDPVRSKSEKKHDATDRVAREIISRESAARLEQMERLRQARLAREAAAPPPVPVAAAARPAVRRAPRRG